MKTAIVTISGFTESDRAASGMDHLRRTLHARWRDDRNVIVYQLRPWKTDVKGLARLMKRDGITQAIIAGYSWGGGYTTPRLVKQLARQFIDVPLVLLCDPVYRPTWLPTWGLANVFGFRALIPGWAKIKMPSHAQVIKGIRQNRTTPRGHAIKRAGKTLTPILIEHPGVTHTNIDNTQQWHDLVHNNVKLIITPN